MAGGKIAERRGAAAPDAASARTASLLPQWARSAADKLPTKWIVGGATALFLAATAAFGGLGTAAEATPPSITIGAPIDAGDYDITVEGVRSFTSENEDVPVFLLSAEDDAPFTVVAVDASVVSRVGVPVGADLQFQNVRGGIFPRTGDSPTLTIDGIGGSAGVTRQDDTMDTVVLQPDLPEEVTIWWRVEGPVDEVSLEIWSSTTAPGAFLAREYETLWSRGEVVAAAVLPISDGGEE